MSLTRRLVRYLKIAGHIAVLWVANYLGDRSILNANLGLFFTIVCLVSWGYTVWVLWVVARSVFNREEFFHEYRRARRNRRGTGSRLSTRLGASSSAAFSVAYGPGDASPRLPTRVGDEPIRARKAAFLTPVEGGWKFRGIGAGGMYGIDDIAECVGNPRSTHSPPEVFCGCGFYALRLEDTKPGELLRTRGHALVELEVELYGRVIVYTRGYRAEKQRVLSATMYLSGLQPCTQVIAGDGLYPKTCDEAAMFVVIPEAERRPLRCAEHASLWTPEERVAIDLRDSVRAGLPTDWTFLP